MQNEWNKRLVKFGNTKKKKVVIPEGKVRTSDYRIGSGPALGLFFFNGSSRGTSRTDRQRNQPFREGESAYLSSVFSPHNRHLIVFVLGFAIGNPLNSLLARVERKTSGKSHAAAIIHHRANAGRRGGRRAVLGGTAFNVVQYIYIYIYTFQD